MAALEQVDLTVADAEGAKQVIAVVDIAKIVEVAKENMRKSAVLNEAGEPWPMSSPPAKLGELGVGVQLYFDFIKLMGVLFLVLQILTFPNLLSFMLGDMVRDTTALGKYTGALSVANFGVCPVDGCATDADVENRCAWSAMEPTAVSGCTQARDVAPILGVLDAAAVVIFLVFALWFNRRWIPMTAEAVDDRYVTPADFTLFVRSCPRILGGSTSSELHKNYAAEMKKLFQEVLATMKKNPVEDPDAVVEVNIVREYDGTIEDFMEYGDVLEEEKACMYFEEQAKAKQDEKSVEKHHTRLEKCREKIKKIVQELDDQGKKNDEEREVVGAYVTLQKEEYKELLLNEYRYAQYGLFRLCQGERLRLDQGAIRLEQACEPSDIFWENMDYNPHKRAVRKVLVNLLTLVVLVVCALLIVSLKSVGTPKSSQPKSPVWLFQQAEVTDAAKCFKICRPELYTSSICISSAGSSEDWEAVTLINSSGAVTGTLVNQTLDTYFGRACAQPLLSPACYGETDARKNWVGVEFSANRSVACARINQGLVSPSTSQTDGVIKSMRVYSCKDRATADMGPATCTAMSVLDLPTVVDASNIAKSGTLQVTLDPSAQCSENVTLPVAQRAYDDAVATGVDQAFMGALAYDCFCQQQLLLHGASKWYAESEFNPASKQLCKDWIDVTWSGNLIKAARSLGSVLAVLVLNQVLLLLMAFFIAWERQTTESGVTRSQLGKLFAAQFINTGLLALLVNAKIESVPDIWSFIKVLQIGSGNYYDLNAQWFTAVGSGLVITIFMQVFSTTLPPLIMARFVSPILHWIGSRGKVTQTQMDQVYQLPEWNLALRLAQSMNVIFCVMMYSGGMPIMYFIGCVYCLVAYWLDKGMLLRLSARPPSYTQEVLVICMQMMPFAAFLHVFISVWSFGNQMLFPSDWAFLDTTILPEIGEGLFNVTMETSEQVVKMYGTATPEEQEALYWDFIDARMLDMARSGSAVLMIVFLFFCSFYIVNLVLTLGLKPVLDPLHFILQETFPKTCAKRRKGADLETATWEDAKVQWVANGSMSSYQMSANDKYTTACEAIKDASRKAEAAAAEGAAEVTL